jgi:hypothetical protein
MTPSSGYMTTALGPASGSHTVPPLGGTQVLRLPTQSGGEPAKTATIARWHASCTWGTTVSSRNQQ